MARSRIVVRTQIRASLERCFDLARDLDLHLESMRDTDETAIAGRTSGLIELGEEVTWRARHFGVYHTHTARITAFDRPRHFRDTMVAGRFAEFEHDHFFESLRAPADSTEMIDELHFRSPLGALGWCADRWVLKRYLRRLLTERAYRIRRRAESEAT